MQVNVTKGINNNYLLSANKEQATGGLQLFLSSIKNFSWRKKKVLICIEPKQNPSAALQNEHTIQGLINQGLLSDCFIIAPSAQYTKFKNEPGIEQLMSYFQEHPIENTAVFILGNDHESVHRLIAYLSNNAAPSSLEVDLDAIGHNLHYYKNATKPKNKVMAMVKANAYGHGIVEVAHHLKDKADYFGVAYVNEGISLRKEGINLPIMVMNPSADDFELCLHYQLEPEIHNLNSLIRLINLTDKLSSNISIQIEIDTGMNRLGIALFEIDDLISLLKKSKFIQVNGLYSHLACAEDPKEDAFNQKQLRSFYEVAKKIESQLGIKTIKHIRNSAGSLRYPESPTDMIRLGIGLYGVDSNNEYQEELRNVSTLKTVISQIRTVEKGETIGYNRTFVAEKNMTIATIAIGYADGFKRLFSNRIGKVAIHGNKAPVVGRVNMDMIMVDISDIEAKEGDEVIVFNKSLHVSSLAKKANTIPYEIFTSIGERVERVYLINL